MTFIFLSTILFLLFFTIYFWCFLILIQLVLIFLKQILRKKHIIIFNMFEHKYGIFSLIDFLSWFFVQIVYLLLEIIFYIILLETLLLYIYLFFFYFVKSRSVRAGLFGIFIFCSILLFVVFPTYNFIERLFVYELKIISYKHFRNVTLIFMLFLFLWIFIKARLFTLFF